MEKEKTENKAEEIGLRVERANEAKRSKRKRKKKSRYF